MGRLQCDYVAGDGRRCYLEPHRGDAHRTAGYRPASEPRVALDRTRTVREALRHEALRAEQMAATQGPPFSDTSLERAAILRAAAAELDE